MGILLTIAFCAINLNISSTTDICTIVYYLFFSIQFRCAALVMDLVTQWYIVTEFCACLGIIPIVVLERDVVS